MHELSIAVGIVESLTERLADEPGRVAVVCVQVGALSGVVPDALRFAWDAACEGSRLDGSTLAIEEIGAAIWCDACGREQPVPGSFSMRCPVCGAAAGRVVAGRELEIRAVDMIDEDADGAS